MPAVILFSRQGYFGHAVDGPASPESSVAGRQAEMRSVGVSAAADALSCPLCLETFRHPLMLPCCGQSFCADCLRQAMAASCLCPLCRCKTSFDAALPNRGLGALLGHDRQDLLAAVAAAPPPMMPQVDLRSGRPGPGLLGHAEHHHMHVPSGGLSPYGTPPLPRQPGCGGWWRAHGHDARCVLYIVLVLLVFFFLRVQEEEYQEMEEDFRRAHPPQGGAHPHLLTRGKLDADFGAALQQQNNAGTPLEEHTPGTPVQQNQHRGRHTGAATGRGGEVVAALGAAKADVALAPVAQGLNGRAEALKGVNTAGDTTGVNFAEGSAGMDTAGGSAGANTAGANAGVNTAGGSAVERAWAAEKAHTISRGDISYVGDARWAAVGIFGTLACVVQLGRKSLRKGGSRRIPGGSRGGVGRRRLRGDSVGGEWARSGVEGEVSEGRV